MSEQNKNLVKRFYNELVNGGNIELIEELLSPNYQEHLNPRGSGWDGFKQFAATLKTAFPDLQVTVEDLIAEGDRVVARVIVNATHAGNFMGSIAPTGRHVSFTGVDIFRIEDCMIIARWNHRDLLGLLRQLGASTLP
ncbi:MAG: ester cyclase [Anaerolineales bacterium]|nr:ester cyclase [Anaerolineales bacterium]